MKKHKKTVNEPFDNTDNLSITPLTEEELQILKASQSELDRSTLPPHDTSDLANAKRYVKKNLFSVIFVTLTVILLIAVIVVLSIIVYKAKHPNSSKDYAVTVGDQEFILSNNDYTFNGVFYFDMRMIASYTNLVVSGDSEKIKFTCPDGTYVRFENGGETATVNGVRVKLGGKAKIIEKTKKAELQCLVPFSFVCDLFSFPAEENTPGMRIVYSSEDNTVIMRRVTYKETGEALKISFSPDCFTIAEDIQMQADRNINPELTFACVKSTELVNKNNPLGDSYVPEGLLSLNDLGCPCVEEREFLLTSNAAHSLTLMLEDMHKAIENKEKIVVTSAYRSYDYQTELFEDYLAELTQKGMSAEQATAELTRTSAFPGESEHQSGLCIDLIEEGRQNLTVSFEDTYAFEWLSSNAFRYGFILRYPEGKESITGYDYEPWHYRFVGLDAARIIHEDNISLEEYLAKF